MGVDESSQLYDNPNPTSVICGTLAVLVDKSSEREISRSAAVAIVGFVALDAMEYRRAVSRAGSIRGSELE